MGSKHIPLPLLPFLMLILELSTLTAHLLPDVHVLRHALFFFTGGEADSQREASEPCHIGCFRALSLLSFQVWLVKFNVVNGRDWKHTCFLFIGSLTQIGLRETLS